MNKLLDAIFSLRYIAVLAVIAPFFGMALMMMLGTLDTINAYLVFFGLEEPDGAVEPGEAAMVKLVASIDHFLFGTILVIFAIGLYTFLFQAPSSHKGKNGSSKPLSWKQVKNLGGMDEMLLKVIIMLLAVAFLEFMLNAGLGELDWPVLVIPLTIVALAIAFRWMSADGDDGDAKKEKAELQVIHLDELEQLAALHEKGAITDAEFKTAKEKLKL